MKKLALLSTLFYLFLCTHGLRAQNWEDAAKSGIEMYSKGMYKSSDSAFTVCLGLLEKLVGKQDTLYANMLSYSFACNFQLGNFEKTSAIGEEHMEITKAVSGAESVAYSTSCGNMGFLYSYLGEYRKAEDMFILSNEICAKVIGKENVTYAIGCNNLAELYRSIGQYARAEPLYHEVKAIYEKVLSKEDPSYAGSCNGLALYYLETGQYAKAEPLLIEAKTIWGKTLGKEHPTYGVCCNNLASVYWETGLYEKAEPYFIESMQIKEKTIGTDHPDYAIAGNNLATLYSFIGQYDKAEQLYLKDIELLERILGKNHQEIANTCNNMAVMYVKMGDYAKAEALYTKALGIWEHNFGKENPSYAATSSGLAAVYQDAKQYEKAEKLFIESLEIREKTLGKNHPHYAQNLSNLGSLYAIIGKYNLAESLFVECIEFRKKELAQLFPLFSEKERSAYLSMTKANYDNFANLTVLYYAQKPSIASELMNQALFLKATVFSSTQKMKNQLLGSGDTSLVNEFARWRAAREQLNKLSNLSTAEREKTGANLQKMASDINEMESNLSRKSALFAKNSQVPQFNWQDLRASLGKGEVAIEMLRVGIKESGTGKERPRYIALFVSAETKDSPEIVVLSNGEDLDSKQLNYYKMCLNLKKEDKSSYNAYWKPIADKLTQMSPNGFTRIFFSPDGVYHQLSLNGLLDQETGKYLSELCKIQVVGTCRDLVENKDRREEKLVSLKKGREIHLFGYPSYDIENQENNVEKSDDRSFSGIQDALGTHLTWTSLPGTKKEVEEVANRLSRSGLEAILHKEKEATEEVVKSLRDPLVLHIATHGYFVSGSLSKKESIQDYLRMKTLEDPFQRCGLALAGCSDPKPGKEDGILTASEAMNLDLDNTELVVLSACETGLGDIVNGEGVFGLQRAFQQAGAKTVLMSLWKVNDEATQLLMSEFYRQLAKGKTKRDAFSAAQNSLKKQFSHPYYWAAFVMIGE